MKYKVGDKVRVRKDLVLGKDYENFTFVGTMEKLRGKFVTIKNAFTDSYYIEEDTDEYSWTDEMLEPVITNWDKVKEKAKQIIDSLEITEQNIICKAIHETKKEKDCRWRNCEDCREWLKEPYQEPSILDDAEKEYLKNVAKGVDMIEQDLI